MGTELNWRATELNYFMGINELIPVKHVFVLDINLVLNIFMHCIPL